MGKKRGNKRQRIEDTGSFQPLGSRSIIHNDSAKDDEERRLESALFGVAYVPGATKEKKHILVLSDDEDEELDNNAGGNELQGMLDSDVSEHILMISSVDLNCTFALHPAILCR